jgi:hypothetical protein
MRRRKGNRGEIEKLKDIIGVVFGVDVDSSSRTMPHPYARAAFSKILRTRGYTLAYIGGMIGKSHATIIHYIKRWEEEVETNAQLRIKYQEIQDKLIENVDPIHTLSAFELKKQVMSLRKENKKLYLEKSQMLYVINEDSMYMDIVELIRDRIGSGDKEKLKQTLKRYFNGVHE